MIFDPQEPPEVGAEIMVPVVQSATRTTLFPEQTVVASGGGFVELIFLRTELYLPVQQARVAEVQDNQARIEITNLPVSSQLTDLGHVRLTLDGGMDLFRSLSQHLMQHHGKSHAELSAALTEAGNKSKPAS